MRRVLDRFPDILPTKDEESVIHRYVTAQEQELHNIEEDLDDILMSLQLQQIQLFGQTPPTSYFIEYRDTDGNVQKIELDSWEDEVVISNLDEIIRVYDTVGIEENDGGYTFFEGGDYDVVEDGIVWTPDKRNRDFDRLGRMFGDLGRRRERDDLAYRQYLNSLVTVLSGRGQKPTIKAAVETAIGVEPESIEITEYFEDLEYEIGIVGWEDHQPISIINIVNAADPSGVRLRQLNYIFDPITSEFAAQDVVTTDIDTPQLFTSFADSEDDGRTQIDVNSMLEAEDPLDIETSETGFDFSTHFRTDDVAVGGYNEVGHHQIHVIEDDETGVIKADRPEPFVQDVATSSDSDWNIDIDEALVMFIGPDGVQQVHLVDDGRELPDDKPDTETFDEEEIFSESSSHQRADEVAVGTQGGDELEGGKQQIDVYNTLEQLFEVLDASSFSSDSDDVGQHIDEALVMLTGPNGVQQVHLVDDGRELPDDKPDTETLNEDEFAGSSTSHQRTDEVAVGTQGGDELEGGKQQIDVHNTLGEILNTLETSSFSSDSDDFFHVDETRIAVVTSGVQQVDFVDDGSDLPEDKPETETTSEDEFAGSSTSHQRADEVAVGAYSSGIQQVHTIEDDTTTVSGDTVESFDSSSTSSSNDSSFEQLDETQTAYVHEGKVQIDTTG